MNEQDHILLDAYFNGLLADTEAEQIRQRVATDPLFGEAFNLRQQMEQWLLREPGREAVAETLRTTGKDFFKQEETKSPLKVSSVNWTRALLVAASLSLLLAATWYFGSSAPPRYEQYAQHSPLAFTERGTQDDLRSAAEKDFSQQQYTQTLQDLDALLRQNPDDLLAGLYKGICLIELNRTTEARNVLQPIARGASALRSEAQWYIALSYLKDNNPSQCKAALLDISAGADRYETAQKLLKKLE